MAEEKRKAIRVKEHLSIQYCFDVNSEPRRWDISTVKDISESGVCLLTGKQFATSDTILLRLRVPSRPEGPVEVLGTVIVSQGEANGTTWLTRIAFKDLSQETQLLFHEYIEWVIKNQGGK